MCYPAPGPRCGAHARASVDETIARHKAQGTNQSALAVVQAWDDFFATPEGVAQLRNDAKQERNPVAAAELLAKAERYEKIYQDRLDSYRVYRDILHTLFLFADDEAAHRSLVSFLRLSARKRERAEKLIDTAPHLFSGRVAPVSAAMETLRAVSA